MSAQKLTTLAEYRARFPRPTRHEDSLYYLFYDALEAYTLLWRELILDGEDRDHPESTELLASFLRGYMWHETAALANRSDQLNATHRVATTFIGYSWIVQETVDAALRLVNKKTGWELRCATTLAMAPERWYRFDTDTTKTQVWSPYREFMKRTFGKSSKAQILRLLIGLDTVATHPTTRPGGILGELLQTAETKKQLANRIYCGQSGSEPQPVPVATLRSVHEALAAPYKDAFRTAYPSIDLAVPSDPEWLLLPCDMLDAVVATRRLGDASRFIALERALKAEFHGCPRSNLNILPLKDWVLERFTQDDLPIDWFLLGEGRQDEGGTLQDYWCRTKWHFCLAANYKQDLTRGLVEFMSPLVNQDRFHKVTAFFRDVYGTPGSVI